MVAPKRSLWRARVFRDADALIRLHRSFGSTVVGRSLIVLFRGSGLREHALTRHQSLPMNTHKNRGLYRAWTALTALAFLAGAAAVRAQPVEVPSTWGGDLSSRPRLTGDWAGVRDELGKKGIVLDVDVLVTPMDVLSGGRSTGGETWGNIDYTLNVDTEKLGLWPGGFLNVS